MRSVVLGSLVFLSAVAVAQPQLSPAAQPQVKKTVAAFNGTWTGDSTMTMPGKPPEKVKVTATCRKIAGGVGVSCELKGQGKTSMPVDQSCLIGYDTAATNVHLMCVTATGEVMDQRGSWSGDNRIQFQPHKGMMMGQQATQTMNMEWTSPREIAARGKTTTADGQTSTWEMNLKRR